MEHTTQRRPGATQCGVSGRAGAAARGTEVSHGTACPVMWRKLGSTGQNIVCLCNVSLWQCHTPGTDFVPGIAPRKIQLRGILKCGSGGRWGDIIQELIVVQEKGCERIGCNLRTKPGRTAHGVIVES